MVLGVAKPGLLVRLWQGRLINKDRERLLQDPVISSGRKIPDRSLSYEGMKFLSGRSIETYNSDLQPGTGVFGDKPRVNQPAVYRSQHRNQSS